jgi:heme exporter protein D
MNINKKIEQIRHQPEHVRVRYVWICVAISMLVVLMFWFFSIASMFAEEKNNSDQNKTADVPNMQEQLQTLKNQAPSLKDLGNQSLSGNDGNNGTASTVPQDAATTQGYPTDNTTSIPQSNNYSSLQKDTTVSQ